MMTFGQFIRYRREKILQQERQEIEFGNSYLASIETEERRPTKLDVIIRLGKALGVLDTTAYKWMWFYSFANEEPYPFPAMYQKSIITKDDLPIIFHDQPSMLSTSIPTLYATDHPPTLPVIVTETATPPPNNSHIQLNYGSSEEEVLSALGTPDKKILIPSRCKWIYEKEGLHIIFTDNKVTDIGFK